MITCPNCNYQHGYDVTKQEYVEAKEGRFYRLPIEMKRESTWESGRILTEEVLGCPRCGQMFMDIL